MNSARWGRAQGPTEALAAGSLAIYSLLPRAHGQTSRRWGRPRWMYHTSISTRTGGCSIISAQVSPPNSGLVAICTPAWRGGARTTSLPLPDRVKNEDSHEGQEMHALPQKEMLTLTASWWNLTSGGHRAASTTQRSARSSCLARNGSRLPTRQHRGAASLPQSLDFCILAGMPAETAVIVCVMEPHCFLDP